MPRPNRGVQLRRNPRGVYEIHWTEQGRSRRVSTRTDDASAAAAYLQTWRAELTAEQDAAAAGTVTGVLVRYFEEHVNRKVLGQGTAEKCRRFLEEHFGAMPPATIRKAHVRAYETVRAVGVIGQPAGPSTVRRELGVLKAALRHAVSEGRLRAGDVPAIALPPASEPRERWLTDGEMARLWDAAKAGRTEGRLSRVEVWLHLAYYTGRRKRAIETLTWDRVDFEANTIDFEEPGRTRTKKRRGVAYMHPTLRAVLDRAKREAGDEARYVLGHSGSVRKALATLARRAGVPDLSPHVLKHTCATHMLRRGVSIWDVAGALATTPATITRVYGKHVPEAQKRAVEVLG